MELKYNIVRKSSYNWLVIRPVTRIETQLRCWKSLETCEKALTSYSEKWGVREYYYLHAGPCLIWHHFDLIKSDAGVNNLIFALSDWGQRHRRTTLSGTEVKSLGESTMDWFPLSTVWWLVRNSFEIWLWEKSNHTKIWTFEIFLFWVVDSREKARLVIRLSKRDSIRWNKN